MLLHYIWLIVTSWAKVSCQSNYHWKKMYRCIECQYKEGWLPLLLHDSGPVLRLNEGSLLSLFQMVGAWLWSGSSWSCLWFSCVLASDRHSVLCFVSSHYENMPIQIYRKLYNQKRKKNQIKISDIFHISAQTIDCGYSLEPPRRGGSNEYPQSMF